MVSCKSNSGVLHPFQSGRAKAVEGVLWVNLLESLCPTHPRWLYRCMQHACIFSYECGELQCLWDPVGPFICGSFCARVPFSKDVTSFLANLIGPLGVLENKHRQQIQYFGHLFSITLSRQGSWAPQISDVLPHFCSRFLDKGF